MFDVRSKLSADEIEIDFKLLILAKNAVDDIGEMVYSQIEEVINFRGRC